MSNTARPIGGDFCEAQQASGHAAPTHTSEFVRSRLALPIFLFTILGTLDVPLTLAGLAQGGHELNPIARALLAHGPATLAGARAVTILATAYALAALEPSAPRTARACAFALVTLFALVDTLSILQLVTL